MSDPYEIKGHKLTQSRIIELLEALKIIYLRENIQTGFQE